MRRRTMDFGVEKLPPRRHHKVPFSSFKEKMFFAFFLSLSLWQLPDSRLEWVAQVKGRQSLYRVDSWCCIPSFFNILFSNWSWLVAAIFFNGNHRHLRYRPPFHHSLMIYDYFQFVGGRGITALQRSVTIWPVLNQQVMVLDTDRVTIDFPICWSTTFFFPPSLSSLVWKKGTPFCLSFSSGNITGSPYLDWSW